MPPLETDERTSDTPITPDNLLARGYTQYSAIYEFQTRLFQKRFDDYRGTKFFVNFREWVHPQVPQTIDVEIAGSTDAKGSFQASFSETSIERAEQRAEAVWRVMGAVYYELSSGH